MNSKGILLLLVCCATVSAALAQKDCDNDHLGNIPLIDLTDGYFNGVRGGLYPEGNNTRPAAHLEQCIANVTQIQPLSIDGTPDDDGRIVMLGIGASNPMTEFQKFIELSNDFEPVNDDLSIVNACVGGQGIQKMYDITDNYWSGVINNLDSEGLSKEQVQVIWIEQDNTNAYDTAFPSAPNALVSDFNMLLQVINTLFPNVQICYITARAYSGFAAPVDPDVSGGLLYPRDYLNGWAVKFLVENVINHATGFETSGPAAQIPLVTWGSYHWTDGSSVRSDGLFLDCEVDLGPDGLHFSGAGENKMGLHMFEYFKSDTTAKYWYYDDVYSGIAQGDQVLSASVFPNPVSGDNIRVALPADLIGTRPAYTIYALDGAQIAEGFVNDSAATIDISTLPAGMFILRITSGTDMAVVRFVRQ